MLVSTLERQVSWDESNGEIVGVHKGRRTNQASRRRI